MKYFSLNNKKCLDQVSEGSLCKQENACISGKGLSCINGVCKCATTQYWNGNNCANLLTYNTGTCKTKSECKGALGK